MEAPTKDFRVVDMPMACRTCKARGGGICGAMTDGQLSELSRFTSRRKVDHGSGLLSQGERILSYASVLKGVIKLTKRMSDGRQQIVGLQFAPDFIGRPYAAESALTAEAATDIEICVVSKPALDRMVMRAPELGHRLHNQALVELDEARDWMLTLGRKTALERVASFLHLIATHSVCDDGGTLRFELPLSRQDIADFLGLTVETVSRQMTKLKQEKVIRIESSRNVTVHDAGSLANVAGIDY
jgi:CRP/FNR family transcriptional regulator, anaerobic regulatory protein